MRCGGVSMEVYMWLGENEEEPWLCPKCLLSELLYVDVSWSSCDEKPVCEALIGISGDYIHGPSSDDVTYLRLG